MSKQVPMIEMVSGMLAKELHRQTIQDQVIRPLIKWLFWHIFPYVIVMIVLNFFVTMGAISLVLYLRR
jgi:hypothetical protein